MEIFEDGYSLNISHGEIVHVGDKIENMALSIGDTLESSFNITSQNISVRL